PSTMWGPFCSVPAVPMMTVVVPLLIRSRVSAQVRSSRKTVTGGRPDGAVSGAERGRCADAPAIGESRRAVTASVGHPLGVMPADPSTDDPGGGAVVQPFTNGGTTGACQSTWDYRCDTSRIFRTCH